MDLRTARAKLMDAKDEYLAERISIYGDMPVVHTEAHDRMAALPAMLETFRAVWWVMLGTAILVVTGTLHLLSHGVQLLHQRQMFQRRIAAGSDATFTAGQRGQ